MSKSDKFFEFPPPLAGFAQLSFTHVNSKLPPDYLDDEWSNRITSSGNNVLNIPQEASIFYGGKVIGKMGAFIQGTFDGVENTFLLDMTDVRFANRTAISGKDLIYGITLIIVQQFKMFTTAPRYGLSLLKVRMSPHLPQQVQSLTVLWISR